MGLRNQYVVQALSDCILLLVCSANAVAQNTTNILRPKEIDDVLVNPGMGIETFQRFNGDAINPGLGWSEEGPTGKVSPAAGLVFPRLFDLLLSVVLGDDRARGGESTLGDSR